MNAPNLFKNIVSVDETNANPVLLKAVITKIRKGVDYFLITYHVWDKKGSGEVMGSYKLYVNDAPAEAWD